MQSLAPKEVLALQQLPAVILLLAPDSVRAHRLSARLQEIHKAEFIERVQLSALTSQTFSTLLDSLPMMSLFSQIKLVLIDVPEKKHPFTEKLLNSLQHISHGTTVVLRFRAALPSKAATAGLPKDSVSVEMEPLVGDKFIAWLAREAPRLGATSINTGALRLIAQFGANDVDAAYKALEQVALFADGQPITEQTVRQVITVIPEAEEFALLDLLDAGALPRAEALTESLLSQGSNAFLLLAMIARNQLNRIAVRSGVATKCADEVLKRELNLTPWNYERTKKHVAKPNLPSMKQAIAGIVRADSRLKGKSLGPHAILSELFSTLAPLQVRDRDRVAPSAPVVDNSADRS